MSQMSRRLGKPTIPMPPIGFAAASSRAVRMMGGDISPDLYRVLTHGRAVDITALREIFGYEPRHTTEQTFEEFRASVRPGPLGVLIR